MHALLVGGCSVVLVKMQRKVRSVAVTLTYLDTVHNRLECECTDR